MNSKQSKPEILELSAVFSGRVQGVGFRITVKEIATQFDVSGNVRNCSDGTVELHVLGVEAELSRFLRTIQDRFSRNIVDFKQSWSPGESNVEQSGGTDFQVLPDKIV